MNQFILYAVIAFIIDLFVPFIPLVALFFVIMTIARPKWFLSFVVEMYESKDWYDYSHNPSKTIEQLIKELDDATW